MNRQRSRRRRMNASPATAGEDLLFDTSQTSGGNGGGGQLAAAGDRRGAGRRVRAMPAAVSTAVAAPQQIRRRENPAAVDVDVVVAPLAQWLIGHGGIVPHGPIKARVAGFKPQSPTKPPPPAPSPTASAPARSPRRPARAMRLNRFKKPDCWTDMMVVSATAPIQCICPNLRCRKCLSVPDEIRGKLVKCQHCQTVFRVPQGKKTLSAALPQR